MTLSLGLGLALGSLKDLLILDSQWGCVGALLSFVGACMGFLRILLVSPGFLGRVWGFLQLSKAILELSGECCLALPVCCFLSTFLFRCCPLFAPSPHPPDKILKINENGDQGQTALGCCRNVFWLNFKGFHKGCSHRIYIKNLMPMALFGC